MSDVENLAHVQQSCVPCGKSRRLRFSGASPSSGFADWSWCLHTGTLAPTCWQFHCEGVFPIHAWYVCRPRENSFLTEIEQCIMIHDLWNASFKAVVLFAFTAHIWGLQMQFIALPCRLSVWGCGFFESYHQDGDYWGADDGSTMFHGVPQIALKNVIWVIW